jgi:hypothetical protein
VLLLQLRQLGQLVLLVVLVLPLMLQWLMLPLLQQQTEVFHPLLMVLLGVMVRLIFLLAPNSRSAVLHPKLLLSPQRAPTTPLSLSRPRPSRRLRRRTATFPAPKGRWGPSSWPWPSSSQGCLPSLCYRRR